MTLIEALAGIAILGTTLVAILVANSRLVAQSGKAQQLSQACRAADQLIEEFWADKENFPRNRNGAVTGQAGWTWRTVVKDTGTGFQLGQKSKTSIVTVQLFGPGAAGDSPAVAVDVLLPNKDDTATSPSK